MSSYLSLVIIIFLLSNSVALVKDDVSDLSVAENSVISFADVSLFEPIVSDRRQYGISISQNEVSSANDDALPAGSYNFLDMAFSYPTLSWGYKDNFAEISSYGGVYSQFKLSQGVMDDRVLINSDFVIGSRLSIKSNKNYVVHLEFDHRSSHLGDEYIIEKINKNVQPSRKDFNEDALSLLLVGGDNLQWHFRYSQFIVANLTNDQGYRDNLGRNGLGYGLSYRGNTFTNVRLTPFISHFQNFEDKTNWQLASTTRFGFLRESMQTDRKIMIAFEYFDGPSFFGEFYSTNIATYGINLNIIY